MVDKRIFWATKKLDISALPGNEKKLMPIGNITVYENIEDLPEPPSQQAKQTGAGEQRVDGRVSAE
jgi:hypothetical protein